MIANLFLTEFDRQFPSCIGHFSRKQAEQALNISESHLRRDCSMLNEVSHHFPGWSYTPGDRGFDRDTFYILWLFRRFCRDLGRGKGLDQLILELNKH